MYAFLPLGVGTPPICRCLKGEVYGKQNSGVNTLVFPFRKQQQSKKGKLTSSIFLSFKNDLSGPCSTSVDWDVFSLTDSETNTGVAVLCGRLALGLCRWQYILIW